MSPTGTWSSGLLVRLHRMYRVGHASVRERTEGLGSPCSYCQRRMTGEIVEEW